MIRHFKIGLLVKKFYFFKEDLFKYAVLQCDSIETFIVIFLLEHLFLSRSPWSIAHFNHKSGRIFQCLEQKKIFLKIIIFQKDKRNFFFLQKTKKNTYFFWRFSPILFHKLRIFLNNQLLIFKAKNYCLVFHFVVACETCWWYYRIGHGAFSPQKWQISSKSIISDKKTSIYQNWPKKWHIMI